MFNMADMVSGWVDQVFGVLEKPPIWTTAEGEELTPDEMDTEHIENCIDMLERRIESSEAWIAVFERELNRRKEVKLEEEEDLPW